MRHLSENELLALEQEMEENPGRRYRVLHFQIKELTEGVGQWALIVVSVSLLQVILLGLILWRVW